MVDALRVAQAIRQQGCVSMLFEGMHDSEAALTTPLQHVMCRTQNACGQCPPCTWVAQGSHPDVLHLRTEGHAIGIEAVRALNAFVHQKATQQSGTFAIIHHAQTLTTAASQALLKIVEEPPEGAHLWLCAPHRFQVLPTLRSRCLIAQLPPTPTQAPSQHVKAWAGWLEGSPLELWQHLKTCTDEQLPELWQELGVAISTHPNPHQAMAWWSLWSTHYLQAQAQGVSSRWQMEACLHGMLATKELS